MSTPLPVLTRDRRNRRLLGWLALALLIGLAGLALLVPVALIGLAQPVPTLPSPACSPTTGGQSVIVGVTRLSSTGSLAADQIGYAQTIIAVGAAMHVSQHGQIVALATAAQESGIRNLPYGDRDSVGLFQQRPSQGWGSRAQIMQPAYAAAKFYRSLAGVSGWEAMAVTVAAQAVQRSAFPAAYAQWVGLATQLVTGSSVSAPVAAVQTTVPLAPAASCPAAPGAGQSGVTGSAGTAPGVTVGESWAVGMCQDFVRSTLGAPYGAPTAIAAWNQDRLKHPGDPAPPPRTPVYWSGGSKGYGHAAVSVGGGWIYTTDYPTPGRIGLTTIAKLTQAWGEHYLGWAGDLNGKVIYP